MCWASFFTHTDIHKVNTPPQFLIFQNVDRYQQPQFRKKEGEYYITLSICTLAPLTAISRSPCIPTAVTQLSCPYNNCIGFRDNPAENPFTCSILHTAHVRSAEPDIRCDPSASRLIQVTMSEVQKFRKFRIVKNQGPKEMSVSKFRILYLSTCQITKRLEGLVIIREMFIKV